MTSDSYSSFPLEIGGLVTHFSSGESSTSTSCLVCPPILGGLLKIAQAHSAMSCCKLLVLRGNRKPWILFVCFSSGLGLVYHLRIFPSSSEHWRGACPSLLWCFCYEDFQARLDLLVAVWIRKMYFQVCSVLRFSEKHKVTTVIQIYKCSELVWMLLWPKTSALVLKVSCLQHPILEKALF